VLYRTILLISAAWVLVTGIVLGLLVTLSWQGVQRLDPVSRHIAYIATLDSVHDALEERFVPRGNVTAQDRRLIAKSIASLERLSVVGYALAEQPTQLVRDATASLRKSESNERIASSAGAAQAIAEALTLLRGALRAERSAQQERLRELVDHGQRELQAAMILAVAIPVAALAFMVFFRRRVLLPLNDLGYLIDLLSRKDYAAAMTDKVDPLMAPLFEKYNRMVRRMRDLDLGHTNREDGLQQDVEKATRALIHQQLALARAERMAAVGDLSARLAHDLRNPLSGVLMALTNLRGEVASAEHSERIAMVIHELERIARLLNSLVDESRQVPERPERLQLNRVIEDAIKLLRYQLDEGVAVKTHIPEGIYCRLPESGFRHVLLNLVTNAAQAIGKGPGTIEIAALVRNGHVELSVSDDGTGFPEELLKAGVHEHATWRKGGTGLGLATARRFALEHGSRLELNNRAEGGAVVVLILPVEDCDAD